LLSRAVTATPALYTLSLHDALPIFLAGDLSMTQLPPCPKCNSPYTYQDQNMLICPECAHEWSPQAQASDATETVKQVRDANGNRSEEHTSELQSRENLVCRLLLEKK